MKAVIHYDTGDTFLCTAWFNSAPNYISMRYKNRELYIYGKNNLAKNGIIGVTKLDGTVLWSLNPNWEPKGVY